MTMAFNNKNETMLGLPILRLPNPELL